MRAGERPLSVELFHSVVPLGDIAVLAGMPVVTAPVQSEWPSMQARAVSYTETIVFLSYCSLPFSRIR